MGFYRWLGVVVAGLGLALWGALAEEARRPAPLGINLSGVVDYSSEIVFVDIMKASRAWISQATGKPWGQGGPLEVDATGVVKKLADGQYAESVIFTGFEKRFPGGIYSCTYEGDGELDFSGDAKILKKEPGKMQVEIQPRNGTATIRIRKTNPENPVRGVRLVMPGFEDRDQKEPFHPDFLKRWQGMSAFRFMDWEKTNNSKQTEWADRPRPNWQSQALAGVALEYQIDLCNRLGVEPWFCMPHLATDDYVRSFARLVKEQLKPGLKIHVEYSNECWNSQFQQARYCLQQGKKRGYGPSDFQAQLQFYSARAREIFRIWEEVLGGRDRLVRVLAAQGANPWTGKQVLDFDNASTQADAIAIAPYFGHQWGSPKTADKVAQMPLDELMTALEKDVALSKKHIEEYAEVARARKVRLVAYEFGQHLVGVTGAENNPALTRQLQAANRHPRMRDLYAQNLRDWNAAGGGLCCIFSSMSLPSKWGSWGVLEHTAQDPATAPKYQAIRDYLDAKPR